MFAPVRCCFDVMFLLTNHVHRSPCERLNIAYHLQLIFQLILGLAHDFTSLLILAYWEFEFDTSDLEGI